MTPVLVRPAREADLDRILAIQREATEAPQWTRAVYEQMLAGETGAPHVDRRLEVGILGAGPVLGYAAGAVSRAGAEIAGELETLAVSVEGRRQGVGSALCEDFLRWCFEGGAKSVQLEVRSQSRGVQRIYAALGFREVGRRPGYYPDPPDDALLMEVGLRSATIIT